MYFRLVASTIQSGSLGAGGFPNSCEGVELSVFAEGVTSGSTQFGGRLAVERVPYLERRRGAAAEGGNDAGDAAPFEILEQGGCGRLPQGVLEGGAAEDECGVAPASDVLEVEIAEDEVADPVSAPRQKRHAGADPVEIVEPGVEGNADQRQT